MKTKREHGNALIYVLIAIALFAALSMTMGRQTDTGEVNTLPDEKAELYATQIGAYAAQAKSVIDQMVLSGSDIGNLDFMLPTDGAFNTPPNGDKVFHPEGGGLNPVYLPAEAISEVSADPPPGWYIGRINNVEWTETTGTDVIIVAYQINKKICEKLNLRITGSEAIPALGDSIANSMIDDAVHTGTNVPTFTTDLSTPSPICIDCHKQASLCVKDNTLDAYGFYTILADR